MKFTFSWLQKYLKTKKNIKDICDKLTMSGIEVSEVINNQDTFKQFKIAHVVEVQNHPNADRLKLCKVNDGNNELNIVCGAPNVKKDMKAVLAPVGTRMSEDFVIEKTKIRGVESEGMLCSSKEIGLGDDSEGIIELNKNAKTGSALSTLYPSEQIIDVEVTPNRSDCLGVYGIARDLAATGLGTFLEKKIIKNKGKFKSNIKIKIDKDTKLHCPAFYGCYIKNVKNCESPEWFKKQLQAVGLKPISALVDITNYLTIDCNRPLHVFDADKIKGDLIVSLAKGGETIQALDEQNYKLSKGMIIIKDRNDILSLAGVIGGKSTGCDLDTKNVFLESAIFNPTTIAKTGRLLNIITDSRYRFERGVDPESVIVGIDEALNLIKEFCGGESSEIVHDGSIPKNNKKIIFDFKYFENFSGFNIPETTFQKILKDLGFLIKKGKKYTLTPPSWRHDVEGASDIIEEVIRIYGYDKIPSQSIYISNEKRIDNRCQIRELNMKRCLVQRGITETVTWSFMSKKFAKLFDFNDQLLEIQNPISNDLDIMRPSIIPNLLQAVLKNIDNGEKNICLFELGPTFDFKDKDIQQIALSGIRYGKNIKHWLKKERNYDIFDVKSDIESVLKCCQLSINLFTLKNNNLSYYHPGKSGTLYFKNEKIGQFGEIHPNLIKKLEINSSIFAFELNLKALPPGIQKSKKKFQNKYFQKVERDFAFLVDKNVEAKRIVNLIKETNNEIIEEINIFDIYEGEGIPDGKKSVAISVTLQPKNKTLIDSEIESICKIIVDNVVKNTDAILREK